jgi:hypothetical protein
MKNSLSNRRDALKYRPIRALEASKNKHPIFYAQNQPLARLAKPDAVTHKKQGFTF